MFQFPLNRFDFWRRGNAGGRHPSPNGFSLSPWRHGNPAPPPALLAEDFSNISWNRSTPARPGGSCGALGGSPPPPPRRPRGHSKGCAAPITGGAGVEGRWIRGWAWPIGADTQHFPLIYQLSQSDLSIMRLSLLFLVCYVCREPLTQTLIFVVSATCYHMLLSFRYRSEEEEEEEKEEEE